METNRYIEQLTTAQAEFLVKEYHIVKRVLREVQAKVGLKDRKINLKIQAPSMPDCGHLECMNNIPQASATTLGGTITAQVAYTPFITKEFSPYVLAGMLAHELGHIANSDTENTEGNRHRQEYLADQFAAKYGFGPALIESFEWAKSQLKREYWNKTGPMHPGLQDRIGKSLQDKRRKRIGFFWGRIKP